jgi:hypothetical protein
MAVDELISVDQIVKVPRGRKAKVNAALLASLKRLKPGTAVALKSFGNVSRTDRQAVGAKVRAHFRIAFPKGTCAIAFHPEGGFPQVERKT